MKRIFVLLTVIVLMFASSGYALYHFNGSWSKQECDICGKTIYRWMEGDVIGDNMLFSPSTSFCPGESETVMGLDMRISVCAECYKKHNMEYRGMLTNAYDKWIDIKHQEYEVIRERNVQNRIQEELKNIAEKIEELVNQREEVKEEFN